MEPQALLTQWVETYSDPLLRTCFLSLGDRALAEDAVQDTFIKAWRALGRMADGPIHEKAWLMRIALNTCRDYRRGQWFRHVDIRQALEELPPRLIAVDPEEHTLAMAVCALPERFRQIIWLYYDQNLTVEEMAQALSLPKSTAHKRLKRAQQLLRQQLEGGEHHE